jgi:hypothetical protein
MSKNRNQLTWQVVKKEMTVFEIQSETKSHPFSITLGRHHKYFFFGTIDCIMK